MDRVRWSGRLLGAMELETEVKSETEGDFDK